MLKNFFVAAAAVLTLSAPALAANADPSTHSGSPRAESRGDNLQTFRAVQKQVLEYPHFTIFDTVNAQIDNGAVTLTGKVTMPYKREAIEKRVRDVAGVTRVVNQIEVLPVSQWDDQLRLQIATAIYSNPAFRSLASQVNPPIHVIVEHGHVTLDGVVLNEVDRAIARSIVGNFMTLGFKNQLKTEAEVKAELEQL